MARDNTFYSSHMFSKQFVPFYMHYSVSFKQMLNIT